MTQPNDAQWRAGLHKGTTFPTGEWMCQECGNPWPCDTARASATAPIVKAMDAPGLHVDVVGMVLDANAPATASAPTAETEEPRCADCGLGYYSPRFPDLLVENEAWRAISPDGEGNGLLCPNCICARLEAEGFENVSAAFRSGPLALSLTTDMMVELQQDRDRWRLACDTFNDVVVPQLTRQLADAQATIAERERSITALSDVLSETTGRYDADLATFRALATALKAAFQDATLIDAWRLCDDPRWIALAEIVDKLSALAPAEKPDA